MAKFFRIVLFVAVSLIAFLAYALFSEPTPSKAEQKLINSIHAHLKAPGDWAKLSDIHPGNWTEVCFIPSMSTGGGNTRESIKRIFGIQSRDIHLPNGIPFASDWTSAAMFFHPPNTVEGFEIPSNIFLGFDTYQIEGRSCTRSKAEALLVLKNMQNNNHGNLLKNISILTPEQLKKMESKDARSEF